MREPGIHNHDSGLWIPGSPRLRPSGYGGRPGMTNSEVGNRFPAFAKPASAGEGRSEKIMLK